MSEIYGLGIAMPMNYKAMVDKLKRFGGVWDPAKVIIESSMLGFKVEMFGNGKVEISGEVEHTEVDLMSKEEIDAALMWAATALIGTLASRGVSVVGMKKIERGSHMEAKRSEILNSKHPVADILNS